MTRNSYQQGYVSNSIRTRRGIAHIIRYRVRTVNGDWKQHSETLYGLAGKKEARLVLQHRLRDASGKPTEITQISVQDFIEAYWKPYLDRRGVKASTRASYESALQRHILPELGALHLADVSPMHIENLIQAKLKGGLSPKSVRNLVGLLQGIFSLATDNDLITRSPIRTKHKPTVHRREKPVWTPEQIKSIIGAVHGVHHALFVTAALTAFRLGELLGLQWKHVDFEARTIKVDQSLWYGQLFSPKTPDSVRTFLFGGVLPQVLFTHFQTTAHKGPDDFIFCKEDGRPLNPDVLRKDVLYPALERLGFLRGIGTSGFHTFRHSAASIVNRRTGNLKLAQTLLGHSSINMTANVYTHTSPESEREAAIAIEKAIYGDVFQVVPCFENKNNSAVLN
jgi:integrase